MKKIFKAFYVFILSLSLLFFFAPSLKLSSRVYANVRSEVVMPPNADLDDPDYNAYLGFTLSNGIFRQAWFDTYGRYVSPSKYFYYPLVPSDGSVYEVDGSFEDAEIKGNGEYSVEFKIEGDNFNSEAVFSRLFISTDIPASAFDSVKLTNVRLYADGKCVKKDMDTYLSLNDLKAPGSLSFYLVNTEDPDDLFDGRLFVPAPTPTKGAVEATEDPEGSAEGERNQEVEVTDEPVVIDDDPGQTLNFGDQDDPGTDSEGTSESSSEADNEEEGSSETDASDNGSGGGSSEAGSSDNGSGDGSSEAGSSDESSGDGSSEAEDSLQKNTGNIFYHGKDMTVKCPEKSLVIKFVITGFNIDNLSAVKSVKKTDSSGEKAGVFSKLIKNIRSHGDAIKFILFSLFFVVIITGFVMFIIRMIRKQE
ncbi:MAG: hypothetical protein VZR00_05060 [Lachnospiraceae bacterium]|jgi:hypothetical protein|nr:hypothetical protein [Lachnospiraceae bacterium]MEE3461246.1 hypothetical protein [Lachnospiraceae bacterium]